MANSCNSIPKFITSNKFNFPLDRDLIRSLKLPIRSKLQFRASASSRRSKGKQDRKEASEGSVREIRKSDIKRRSLISISPVGERWDSQWDCDYVLTLSELELEYLAVDGEQEKKVNVSFTCQQHTGFGLSVHGHIATSFNRECSWCSEIFCKEIDTSLDVTVLPEQRESKLPELGGDDSVIYIKYGSEAELDSFIQDKILVAALTQDTCSETCGESPITLYSNEKEKDYKPRWPQLLRLKQALLEKETQFGLDKRSDANFK
ncbi:hypothetical protein LUZ63_001837 [Rhynchospora breviuscula]|uniref:Uncharacterized protein n=1 Tax=Rhynchospora breviuscula TaxID=2022672 RepID=A0A9Q0HYA6_9POAL|nr:hypothetical protein LUZ63_001837 [Rhynchospora breviuscula]